MSTIRVPKPDDIFRKWVEWLDYKEYRKLFVPKNADIPKSKISPAENIENIQKDIFVLITIKARAPQRVETKIIKVSQLKKIEFYDYPTIQPVPIFKSIKKVKCEDCNGTGTKACSKCDGTGKIKCPKCGGKGWLKCNHCGGKGKIVAVVKVKVSKDKTVKKEIEVTCPTCHGTGKIVCEKCGGTGYVPCPECGGSGKLACKTCGGHGHLIKFNIGPTTAGEKTYHYFSPKDYLNKKEFNPIIKQTTKAQPIVLNSIEELTKENLLQMLGYEPPNLEKIKKELNDILKPLKTKDLLKSYTIKVYPLIRIMIRTIKGKKAEIVGLGTVGGYSVVRIK